MRQGGLKLAHLVLVVDEHGIKDNLAQLSCLLELQLHLLVSRGQFGILEYFNSHWFVDFEHDLFVYVCFKGTGKNYLAVRTFCKDFQWEEPLVEGKLCR